MADVTVVREYGDPRKGGPNNLQNDGGMPKQTRGFTTQEHEVTNQPQDGGQWNPDMENPLGPK